MKSRSTIPAGPAKEAHAKNAKWAKTPFTNLIRYTPSGTYFARLRVHGRLVVRSLKTQVLSVAKLRLADVEKAERGAVERKAEAAQGKMLVRDALRILEERIAGDVTLKPRSRCYYAQRLTALFASWPELKGKDIRSVTPADCLDWASRFANQTCPSAFNNTIAVLRRLFEIAIEQGVRYENPAANLKRVAVRPKRLRLPGAVEFQQFVEAIEVGGGGRSKGCADLVRFLAYGGFRLGEAIQITWGDCNFQKKEITVRGDVLVGTKNGEVRKVPMIGEMIDLLTRLQAYQDSSPMSRVVPVKECQKAMDRGARIVGMHRITHHDLRHLFATRCIEAGVDIPTVSRWLGHKDGGALAMKVYGHLRDDHSAQMAARVSFGSPKTQISDTTAPVRG